MVGIATNKAEQVALMAREISRAEPELRAFIADMNEDEQADLVAILWVGRGVFEAEEFTQAVDTARQEKTTPTEDYLMATPNLAYDIEAGLEALGVDVSAVAEDVMGR
ncbi:DUF3775 domain-containing protein [Tritonibacter scottomollicae]|uniref:DUF3775 domain-containing protein n=1 Tax=Tritonibacter scottomollicae TaxID=483013 RepID=A0ABZ0HBV2_TRISK|nr:DUF3775 domain-containing protein [Tritonibacter scottomollicae]WOI32278.1 DUF3775 domain-containing protein [Tritonibacter scottomollicae]